MRICYPSVYKNGSWYDDSVLHLNTHKDVFHRYDLVVWIKKKKNRREK